MTTRRDLVEDLQGVESILCALEGVGPEISEKAMKRAAFRCLWHILELLIRRTKW